jgi:hypothetical protein
MNPIGGYFELELRKGEEYHKNAIRLNTGRNALELIFKVKQYKKVFIPYYTCDVILEPFNKLKIDYEFYSIDEKFEPLFNYNKIKENEGFLYINYFGLKDSFISTLSMDCKNLIIDNSQAFYSLPEPGIPTFYSCRKFFGVPDGAYLFMESGDTINFPADVSLNRLLPLVKRIEFGPEEGYNDYKINEQNLVGQPILHMSKLTRAIMCNIDYEFIKTRRRDNFFFLIQNLSKYNKLNIELAEDSVPMVYPFLINKPDLKQKLFDNKIYIATYWPNALGWTKKDSLEYKYAQQIVHLPIDQRYALTNYIDVIKIIKKIIK